MSATTPIASLPMYDWPEVQPENDAAWTGLRDAFRAVLPDIDVPEALTRPGSLADQWRDPALIFSQCCWGPLRLGLIDHLRPLAQPDYSVFAGGRGPFYRSTVVARAGTAAALGLTDDLPVPPTPAADLLPGLLGGSVFALNGRDSLSGYLALQDDLGADPCILAAGCVTTGGHRASVIALAEGRADIAAIDCRSWHLAQRYEPCAAGLVVVGWTSERLGLPYVTSRATDVATARVLAETLRMTGCHPLPAGS